MAWCGGRGWFLGLAAAEPLRLWVVPAGRGGLGGGCRGLVAVAAG